MKNIGFQGFREFKEFTKLLNHFYFVTRTVIDIFAIYFVQLMDYLMK